MAGDTCDVCNGESGGTFVGVASVPGAPISIAWCDACMARDTAPSWIFDHDFVHVAGGDAEKLVPWARSRVTWSEGRYIGFDAYVQRWTPERVAAALADYDAAARRRPPEETPE